MTQKDVSPLRVRFLTVWTGTELSLSQGRLCACGKDAVDPVDREHFQVDGESASAVTLLLSGLLLSLEADPWLGAPYRSRTHIPNRAREKETPKFWFKSSFDCLKVQRRDSNQTNCVMLIVFLAANLRPSTNKEKENVSVWPHVEKKKLSHSHTLFLR